LFFCPFRGNIKGKIHQKAGDGMKVRLNENPEIVATIKEGLKQTGGYCPCRRERTDDTKCVCKEFKEQIKDPDFEGYCHCMLYYKEK
jgi:ferredoxin-thioredoxin reductase catalytic subunit